jgi:hypothetical protein
LGGAAGNVRTPALVGNGTGFAASGFGNGGGGGVSGGSTAVQAGGAGTAGVVVVEW